ncbi:MAG: MBL fold metallo-hydrolase [Bacteroidales bacterium]|nr:MBL fold metallo-hydrolase [Bacteroidales bacterium]
MKRIMLLSLIALAGFSLSAQNIYHDEQVTVDKIEKGTYKINYRDAPNMSSMYVVVGKKKAVVIDAGDKDYDLMSLVRKCTDKPVVLLLTHTHGDHLGAMNQFEELYVNEKENLSQIQRNFKGKVHYVKDGDVFKLGGKSIQALEIVGHTAGGMIYCDYDTGNCYSGDCFGTGQVWLQFGSFDNPISVYLSQVEKMIGYMSTRHITHIYTGHFGQEECMYGINYIQDMGELARKMLSGDFESEHHNRSAESSPVRMTTLRRATIVYHPDRVR